MDNQVNLILRRTLIGKVISDKMHKTVTVLIERYTKHAVYNKIILRTNKYHVHDKLNQAKIGDIVEIQESRPISKTKAWIIARIVQTNVTV